MLLALLACSGPALAIRRRKQASDLERRIGRLSREAALLFHEERVEAAMHIWLACHALTARLPCDPGPQRVQTLTIKATVVHNLGAAHYHLGQTEEARACMSDGIQMLERCEQMLKGGDSPLLKPMVLGACVCAPCTPNQQVANQARLEFAKDMLLRVTEGLPLPPKREKRSTFGLRR